MQQRDCVTGDVTWLEQTQGKSRQIIKVQNYTQVFQTSQRADIKSNFLSDGVSVALKKNQNPNTQHTKNNNTTPPKNPKTSQAQAFSSRFLAPFTALNFYGWWACL